MIAVLSSWSGDKAFNKVDLPEPLEPRIIIILEVDCDKSTSKILSPRPL